MFKMNGYKPGLPRTRQLDMVQRYAEGGLVRAPQRPADRRPPTSTPGGADMVDYHTRRIEGYTKAINDLRSQGREVPEDYYRMVRESQEALSPPPLAPQMPPPAPPMPGPDPQVDPNPRFSGRDTPPSAPPMPGPDPQVDPNPRFSGRDLARMRDVYPVVPTSEMPVETVYKPMYGRSWDGMGREMPVEDASLQYKPVEVAQPTEVSSEPFRPRQENPARAPGFWDTSSARIGEYFERQGINPVTGIGSLLPDDPDLPTAGDRMAQGYGVPSGEGEFGSGQSRNRGFGPPSPDMEGQLAPQGISGVTNPAPRSAGAPATGAAPPTGANASPSRGASAPAGTPPRPTMRPPMQQPDAPAQGSLGGTGSPGVRGIGSLGAEDTPSAPVVQTAPGAKPAQSESSPEDYEQKDFYDFLINAGLNILASDSPYFGQAIGEGGVAGLKSVKDAQDQRYDRARQEIMDKLITKKTNSDISQGERRLDLTSEQIRSQNALGWGRIASQENLAVLNNAVSVWGAQLGADTRLKAAQIGADATTAAAAQRAGAAALGERTVDPEKISRAVDNVIGIQRDNKGVELEGSVSLPNELRAPLQDWTAYYITQTGMDPTAAAGAALTSLGAYMKNNPASEGFLGFGSSTGGYELNPDAGPIPRPFAANNAGGGGGQPTRKYVPGQGLQ
jgi:hypothetical protein